MADPVTVPTDVDKLLITAMVKLHKYVVHAGTNFEDNALSHFGVAPPFTIFGYGELWRQIAMEFGITV